MTNDPYWNSVVLAMHMDDVGLTDLKGHAVTLAGNAARSATQSVFGGYSAYFDGTGDYLTISYASDLNLNSSEFTLEALVKCEKTTGIAVVFDFRGSGAGASSWCLFIDYTARTAQLYDGTRSSIVISTAANSIPGSAEWFKLIISRSGTTTTLRIVRTDGTNYTSSATYNPSATNSTGVRIGNSCITSDGLIGYIDELRITKGVVRYSGAVAWPTEAFPNTPPQLSGTVKDANNNLVARAVRAYRRSDGILGGATTSSASDGTFVVNGYDDSPHYVVCLDDDLNENAIILDNITPV